MRKAYKRIKQFESVHIYPGKSRCTSSYIYMPHATWVLQWGFHFGNKNEIQHKCNETQSLLVCFHRALLGALPSLYWRRQGLNNYSGAFLRPVLFRTSQPSWLSIDKGLILLVLTQYIDASVFPIFRPSKNTPNLEVKAYWKGIFIITFSYILLLLLFSENVFSCGRVFSYLSSGTAHFGIYALLSRAGPRTEKWENLMGTRFFGSPKMVKLVFFSTLNPTR